MSTKKHRDYDTETERLKYMKDYIEKTIAATDTYRDIYKSNIDELRESHEYSEDTRL